MRREARWIQDALDAASDIRERTEESDLTAFTGDRHIQHEIKYCFIVIAEALARLKDHAPELARQIAELDKIRRFRNVLAHE